VQELFLLSPSSNYPLLNGYLNLCAVIIQALMSLHQNNKLYLVYDKRCLVSHWQPASEISMLLTTTFLELRVVAGEADSGQVAYRPSLDGDCAVALRSTAWSERGMGAAGQV
jgi:hypothetical protein